MEWDWKMWLFAGLGLLGLYLIGSALVTPLRLLVRLLVSLVLGGVLLGVVNLAGSAFSFHIAVNPLTMLAVGLFPLPGLILLVLLVIFVA